MRLVTTVLLAFLLLVLVLALAALELGWHGAVGGFVFAALPTPAYVLVAIWLDRFEPEPGPTLLKAFLWGAAVAAPFAMILDGSAGFVLAGALGQDQAQRFISLTSAPVIEELSKALALAFLFARRPEKFDNVTDGVVYAILIGLGFAMSENVLYYGRAMEAREVTASFLVRGVAMPFTHPLFTAVTGVGLGYARERRTPRATILFPILGLAGAILLHALWNYTTEEPPLFLAAYFLIMMPTFVGAYILVERSLSREASTLRSFLEPLVQAGQLSREARDRACTPPGAIRRLREWWRQDDPEIAAIRRFRSLAAELAFARLRRGEPAAANPSDAGVQRLVALAASPSGRASASGGRGG